MNRSAHDRIAEATLRRFGEGLPTGTPLPAADALAAMNERSVCRSYRPDPLPEDLFGLLCATAHAAPREERPAAGGHRARARAREARGGRRAAARLAPESPARPSSSCSVERFGTAERCGWTGEKLRQYAHPQRADVGAFVRAKGLRLD